MTVQLKVGKYYRTRADLRAYCVGMSGFPSAQDNFVCEVQETYGTKVYYYFENGNWSQPEGEDDSRYAIVAEEQ